MKRKITFSRRNHFMVVGLSRWDRNHSQWDYLFKIPFLGLFMETDTERAYTMLKRIYGNFF